MTIMVWSISSIFVCITYLSLYKILYSEQYRVIVGYITTPLWKASAISCKYYYYGWIYITDFSCYLLLLLFLQHKNAEQHCLVIILNIGCERWTAGQFEGQSDCCERDWFIVRNRPLLLWLTFLWYGTHPIFEWQPVLGLWRLHKLYIWPLIKKRLSFGILIKFLGNGTGRTLDRGNCDKNRVIDLYRI